MLDPNWILSMLRKRMPHHEIEQIVEGQVVFRFTLNVLSHGKPMAFSYVYANSDYCEALCKHLSSRWDVVDWIAITVAEGMGVSLLDDSVDKTLITK